MLGGYDYWGFGDMDVIYGDIRGFYNDHVLTHNVVSALGNRVCGHLCLLKNNEMMRNAFQQVPGWKAYLSEPDYQGVDEQKLTKIFMRHRKHPRWLREIYGLFDPYQRNNFFKDQYATPLIPQPWHDGTMDHPIEWYWRDGRVTNRKDGDREFLYLHFMNYRGTKTVEKVFGDKPPWRDLEQLVHFDYHHATNGWVINENGFSAAP